MMLNIYFFIKIMLFLLIIKLIDFIRNLIELKKKRHSYINSYITTKALNDNEYTYGEESNLPSEFILVHNTDEKKCCHIIYTFKKHDRMVKYDASPYIDVYFSDLCDYDKVQNGGEIPYMEYLAHTFSDQSFGIPELEPWVDYVIYGKTLNFFQMNDEVQRYSCSTDNLYFGVKKNGNMLAYTCIAGSINEIADHKFKRKIEECVDSIVSIMIIITIITYCLFC